MCVDFQLEDYHFIDEDTNFRKQPLRPESLEPFLFSGMLIFGKSYAIIKVFNRTMSLRGKGEDEFSSTGKVVSRDDSYLEVHD